MKIRIAAVCAVLVAGLAYFAATALAVVNWDGSDFAVNNNWSNASNWVGNVAPTSVDDAVFNSANFAGGWTPQVVTVIAGDEANSLAFQGAKCGRYPFHNGLRLHELVGRRTDHQHRNRGRREHRRRPGGHRLPAKLHHLDDFQQRNAEHQRQSLLRRPLAFAGTGTTTVSGSLLGGGGGITKNGSGQLVLSGPNASLFDAWTINGGKVSAGVSTAVNSLGSGAISLSGSTLDLTPTADTSASGLSGRQFASTISDTAHIDFTQTAGSTRTDATIDSNDAGVLPAGQAIQWTGKVNITAGGSYQFQIASDDGSRLFVDGVLVVQNDGPRGKDTGGTSAALTLSAGLHDIRMDYVNSGGGGAAPPVFRPR